MKQRKPLFRIMLGAAFALTVTAGLMTSRVAPAHAQKPTPVPTIMSNTTLAISIAQQTIQPGEAFDVAVKITSDTPSRGAQAGLRFDPKLVEVVGAAEGDYYKTWAKANSASTVLFPANPAPDDAKGLTAPLGVAIMGGKAATGDGPTGSGTLVIYKLKAKLDANGTAQFDLTDVVVGDTNTPPGQMGGVQLQGAQVAIGGNATPVAVQPTAVAVTLEPTQVPPTLEPTVAPRKSKPAASGVPWEIVLPIIGIVVLGGGVGVVMVTRRKPASG